MKDMLLWIYIYMIWNTLWNTLADSTSKVFKAY